MDCLKLNLPHKSSVCVNHQHLPGILWGTKIYEVQRTEGFCHQCFLAVEETILQLLSLLVLVLLLIWCLMAFTLTNNSITTCRLFFVSFHASHEIWMWNLCTTEWATGVLKKCFIKNNKIELPQAFAYYLFICLHKSEIPALYVF